MKSIIPGNREVGKSGDGNINGQASSLSSPLYVFTPSHALVIQNQGAAPPLSPDQPAREWLNDNVTLRLI